MTDNQNKALRNLKMAIYTPILFGIMFVAMIPFAQWLDADGSLVDRISKSPLFNPGTKFGGGVLIFLGINTWIYFRRFVQALHENKQSASNSSVADEG